METKKSLNFMAKCQAIADIKTELQKQHKTYIHVSDKQLKIYWRNLELEITASEKDFISGPTQTVILWDRETKKFYKETR